MTKRKLIRLSRKKPVCARGHPMEEAYVWHGQRRCRACASLRKRQQTRARLNARIPAGALVSTAVKTNHQLAALLSLIEKPRGQAGPRRPRRRRTHCVRGHPFDGTRPNGWRTCSICARLYETRCVRRRRQKQRPKWAIHPGGGRVSVSAHDRWYRATLTKLRQAIVASHSDRTGRASTTRVRQDILRLNRFRREQREWYTALGLDPPKGKGGRRLARIRDYSPTRRTGSTP